MKVEIITETDSNFSLVDSTPKIQCKQFGEVWVACDGKRSVIGGSEEDAIKGLEEAIKTWNLPTPIQEEVPITEEVVEVIPQPPIQKGTPIENHKETNSFDWFSGTSWAGKKQGF
jgi:hypothetical protein